MGAGDILDVDEIKSLTRNSTVIVIAKRRDQRFSQVAAADEAIQDAKWIWVASSASFASRSVATASSQRRECGTPHTFGSVPKGIKCTLTTSPVETGLVPFDHGSTV
jgi:hypothetical protein